MDTSSVQSLIERTGRCDTMAALAPIMTILICLSIATAIMVYKLNILESIGAYVLMTFLMGMISAIIAYMCAYHPRWAGHVGLVLVGGWALYVMNIFLTAGQ